MNANPSSLTPEERGWGAFYIQLHRSAERLRRLMNTAPDDILADESDAATEANQSTRPAHYAPRRRAGQAEVTR